MDPGVDLLRILRESRPLRIRIRKTHCKFSRQHSTLHALKHFDSSQKVWVGGLNDSVTWKDLQELVDSTGKSKSKWVEVLGKGQACVCYGTAEEAQTAIATLKSSSCYEFDVWTLKSSSRYE